MPEDMVNPVTGQRTSSGAGGKGYSAKGSAAGQYYDSSVKIAKDNARQAWLTKKGWAGLGGAARRPRDWETQFETDYAKAQGQQKGLKTMPSTSPSPAKEVTK